ncbi:ABC transporter C family member 8 [Tanacetum coccineum]
MRMRSALMVAVYEKQLRLSNLGRKRHLAGEVVNYIAVDAYGMVEFPMLFHDKRLRSTSEILNNMKVIKLQSWEEKFKKVVESCRDVEFHWLREAQFKKVKVSFDRITSFLVDDELKDNRMTTKHETEKSGNNIRIQDGNFYWDPESTTPTLRNVNLEVKRGQKVAVCGSFSFLFSQVDVFGSIDYVSQISWIQSGTIQDNILYGKPINRTMYEKAIKACALDKDIEPFKHGDLTEIGQRGLNMSGGQKQRIQLARAVYNDVDIYLLDDPFSSVDAHTAATLFNARV